MDGLVRSGGVTLVHLLALAGVGAFPLAGPDQTDILVALLGDGYVVAIHHAGDGALTTGAEPAQDGEVSVGVEHGRGSRAGAGVAACVPQ